MNVCVALLVAAGVPLIVPVVELKTSPLGKAGFTDQLE